MKKTTYLRLNFAILMALLRLSFASLAGAQTSTSTLNLAWDDTQTGVSYRVYRSMVSGTYVKDCTAAPTNNCRGAIVAKAFAWTPPIPVGKNFLVVTAYAPVSGTEYESGYSNEVSVIITPNAPGAFRIPSFTAEVKKHKVILRATTSRPAQSTLMYAFDSTPNVIVVDTKARLAHQATLKMKELKPHTLYSYTWAATAKNGDQATAQGFFLTN